MILAGFRQLLHSLFEQEAQMCGLAGAFDVHRSVLVCECRRVSLKRSDAARVQLLQAQTRGCAEETHSFIPARVLPSRRKDKPGCPKHNRFPSEPPAFVTTRQTLNCASAHEATPSFDIFKCGRLRRSREFPRLCLSGFSI